MLEPKDLLQEVSKLSKKFDAAHESKFFIERFNFFEILDVATDEKKICRFFMRNSFTCESSQKWFSRERIFSQVICKKSAGLGYS